MEAFIQKLSIYLKDVVENMTNSSWGFLVVFLLLPEGAVLASAPVFHKLSEVREVTCTVTVLLHSSILLSGAVHGGVPRVGSVLQMVLEWQMSWQSSASAGLSSGNSHPACAHGVMSSLWHLSEGRVTDGVLFFSQWAPSRRGSIAVSQE